MENNKTFAVILTTENYIIGVKVLAWSLKSVKSRYNLVVLYTPETISRDSIEELKNNCSNISVKPIDLLKTPDSNGKKEQALSYFDDTWTKFQVFSLTEYKRVVLLDADMLIRKNVDSLMELELPEGWIGAAAACICNPKKTKSYPASWNPYNCSYSENSNPNFDGYFNSGLIVLQPTKSTYENIINKFRTTTDWSKYPFPDQDFLNEVYRKKWIRLPYTYNALRGFLLSHPNMWKDKDVHIVHYIYPIKPWQDKDWDSLSEERRKENPFYTVNSWWYEACQDMVSHIC